MSDSAMVGDQPLQPVNDGHVHVPADLFAPAMTCAACGTTLDPLTRQPLYGPGNEVELS